MKKQVFFFVAAWSAGVFITSCDKDSGCPSCPTGPTMPTKGLVAYYPFDGNAGDESDNGLDGQLNGAPEKAEDRKGNAQGALRFDGIDDYASIPFGLNFTGDFTIAFWIHYDAHAGAPNPQALFSKGENCPDGNPNYEGHSYDLGLGGEYLGSGKFEGENHFTGTAVRTGGYYTDKKIKATTQVAEVNPREWFFVVWSFDAAEKRFQLSVNGRLLSDNELPHLYEEYFGNGDYRAYPKTEFGTLHQTTSAMTIGALESYCDYIHQYCNFFKGILDDIRIYNRILDESEIALLYSE